MKIYNNVYINRNLYTPRFKGNEDRTESEWHEFGCIDPVNERTVLDYIRDKHWENTSRYYLLYERECNMPKLELDEFIREHTKYNIPLDHKYFNSYPHTTMIEPNVYRGAMPNTDKDFKELKKAGIQRIVEFKRESRERQKLCKKYGIKYTYVNLEIPDIYNMEAFKTKEEVIERAKRVCRLNRYSKVRTQKEIKQDIKLWEQESREFIDNFTDFIYAMQNENTYIGCGDGLAATNTGLCFDYFFNPKRTHSLPKARTENRRIFNELKGLMRNLYLNLTEEDKKKMGWDKDFDELFLLKLRRR